MANASHQRGPRRVAAGSGSARAASNSRVASASAKVPRISTTQPMKPIGVPISLPNQICSPGGFGARLAGQRALEPVDRGGDAGAAEVLLRVVDRRVDQPRPVPAAMSP